MKTKQQLRDEAWDTFEKVLKLARNAKLKRELKLWEDNKDIKQLVAENAMLKGRLWVANRAIDKISSLVVGQNERWEKLRAWIKGTSVLARRGDILEGIVLEKMQELESGGESPKAIAPDDSRGSQKGDARIGTPKPEISGGIDSSGTPYLVTRYDKPEAGDAKPDQVQSVGLGRSRGPREGVGESGCRTGAKSPKPDSGKT